MTHKFSLFISHLSVPQTLLYHLYLIYLYFPFLPLHSPLLHSLTSNQTDSLFKSMPLTCLTCLFDYSLWSLSSCGSFWVMSQLPRKIAFLWTNCLSTLSHTTLRMVNNFLLSANLLGTSSCFHHNGNFCFTFPHNHFYFLLDLLPSPVKHIFLLWKKKIVFGA